MKNLPPKFIPLLKKIGQIAAELGTSAFVVGGFVRDLIIGVPSDDLDIVVEISAIDFAKNVADQIDGELDRVHEKFGTATVKFKFKNEIKIDFVTARREVYETPCALPTVTFSDLADDLHRRDFTINTMVILIDPDNFGKLIDPLNGHDDLRQKKIRVLHKKSFADDATRIFRAIRYEQRYNCEIDLETENLIQNAIRSRYFDLLSGERIRNEFIRIFDEDRVAEICERLRNFAIFEAIDKNWKVAQTPDFSTLHRSIEWTKTNIDDQFNSESLFWIALKIPTSIAIRFAFEKQLRKIIFTNVKIDQLPKDPKPSEIYFHFRSLPIETLISCLPNSEIELYLTKLRKIRPQINGDDLIREGWKAGPEIADELWRRFAIQLDERSKR